MQRSNLEALCTDCRHDVAQAEYEASPVPFARCERCQRAPSGSAPRARTTHERLARGEPPVPRPIGRRLALVGAGRPAGAALHGGVGYRRRAREHADPSRGVVVIVEEVRQTFACGYFAPRRE